LKARLGYFLLQQFLGLYTLLFTLYKGVIKVNTSICLKLYKLTSCINLKDSFFCLATVSNCACCKKV
jgi:hypothetical protein